MAKNWLKMMAAVSLTVAALVPGGPASAGPQVVGQALSWGNNTFGQLGPNVPPSNSQRVPVNIPGDFVAVAGGTYHSLGLAADGTVWAWGGNSFGELGDGTDTSHTTPAPVPGLTGIVDVAAGFGTSYALGSDGQVRSWGNNQQGQLGLGAFGGTHRTPALVSGLPEIDDVESGDQHVLARTPDGFVYSWGCAL
ncbi:hypothetical protein Acor_12100 [Acrocarpospora corrugata]|uniref:Uncharacterized protein n=1 Tax=Acrocarpospora corrugata TaxID=35763 RepID=A0A5M3VQT9_9ACTN|nr:hypothetical protein [Acrocarpospora corrugata]GER99146.1 hypothetical protein Acor_12100 [Acrocarpospora corrugata]